MKTILISSFSSEAASKTKGVLLRNELEKLILSSEDVAVDFSGITRFASPFFNNSFASLALQYGFETVAKIHKLNISDTGRNTYDTSIANAKLISQKPEFTDELTKIVNNVPKKGD